MSDTFTLRVMMDERTGTSLKDCLERVELFHSAVANTRSEIMAMRAKSLAKLKECEALVNARSDALLAKLDDIEVRRKAAIETAIVVAEDGPSDLTALGVIKSSCIFYAMKSFTEPDWSKIQDSLRLLEFKETPVFGKVTESTVRDGKIWLRIPDSNLLWWKSAVSILNQMILKMICVSVRPVFTTTGAEHVEGVKYDIWIQSVGGVPYLSIKMYAKCAILVGLNIGGELLDDVFLTAEQCLNQ